MTQTYAQIQQQISDLKHQADLLLEREVAAVVQRIKVAIEHYRLTPVDLFGSGVKAMTAVSHPTAYSDGAGNIWGGRGPRPAWLRNALSDGHSLDEFAVRRKHKAAKLRVARRKGAGEVKYRGVDGQTWTGFGPKPRWLKEAVAKGASLEDLAVK